MRVKAGEFQKEIPQEYARATEILTLADWEKPEKVRLTPMERFRFAEAAWRAAQTNFVKEYLHGRQPEEVVFQHNRQGDTRIVVRYSAVNGVKTQAIVPKWVARACPLELKSHQNENWKI